MKKVPLQYGNRRIEIAVPASADVLGAEKVELLTNPAEQIFRSLNEPVAAPPLCQLALGKSNAAVVVSDNTRPVPYKGPDGILYPIIETLKRAGISSIKIIVGCGTHLPMTKTQLRQMLGDAAFQPGVEVINHDAADKTALRSIGRTERTPDVTVNRHYLDAELKIVTGLVEPHFMAGFSGGRKAVCPGICGWSVMYGFHSASILNEKAATSLLLQGNPCHEEALRIAKMAGVDFAVNVTINCDKQITGVFSGELEKSHLTAVERLRSFVVIQLDRLYDIVITHSGDVGINHYQCAKSAFEAAGALKQGGRIILTGDLADTDPVGGPNYRDMLRLLVRLGPQSFVQTILADDWSFVPEQWQVQMWAKVFQELDSPRHLYICAAQLEDCPEDLIAEVNVASRIRRLPAEGDIDFVRRMTQQKIDRIVKETGDKKILILPDGPYAVPVL
jgi:nickel-dependent lactate racemase